MSELTLKWGTLKGWDFSDKSGEARPLLQEYHDIGACISAMAQRDTDRQKEIICELIELCDDHNIYNDWDGKYISKKQAKEYVMNYGRSNK